MVGAAFVGLFGRADPREAAAAICKQTGGKCRRHGSCCSHFCSRRGRCAACGRDDVCSAQSFCGGAADNCECLFTVEGTRACVGLHPSCRELHHLCGASDECPVGAVCVQSCCEHTYCRPLCGFELAQPARATAGAVGRRSDAEA